MLGVHRLPDQSPGLYLAGSKRFVVESWHLLGPHLDAQTAKLLLYAVHPLLSSVQFFVCLSPALFATVYPHLQSLEELQAE